jgi:dTDP-4-dehydrorhamnose reductase
LSELTKLTPGANGPLPNEFLEMYPEVKVVRRQGEVNAWDNAEFREAVKATNKSQIVIAGIVTDVCKWIHNFISSSTVVNKKDEYSG